MSQEDVDVARRAMEAWGSRHPEQALEYLHPEVEYDATVRPDGKVWHGREGVRRAMVEWTGAWTGWRVEVEGYLDAGHGRVVVLWQERGQAKGSGALMAQEGASLLTIRDGMIVSFVASLDRQGTLKAVGLAE
jgi:ketosteroid isomerase-like protein